MKIFGLTLVMALAIGGAAMADTATLEVFPGWNIVSCPLAPLNLVTDPEVNPEMDYTEPYFAFDEIQPDLEAGRLSRVDAVSGNTYKYYIDEAFGKLLLGDAYVLYVPSATFGGQSTLEITYPGIKSGIRATDSDPLTDMWISCPGFEEKPTNLNNGGWHFFGTPYQTPVDVVTLNPDESLNWHVWFTDGNEMVNWMDAVEVKHWVKDAFFGLQPSGQLTVGYNYDVATLMPGQGYYFKTDVDNIAMVIIP